MYTYSFFGFLKNDSNSEYRCNKATRLQTSLTSPSCLMNFQLQSDGSFGILSVQNNQYFQENIGKMIDFIYGSEQTWRLIPHNGSQTQFYIQNVKSGGYMTNTASKLHNGTPGANEIWRILEITSLATPWVF
jgi:hypothetical protein